MHRATPRCLPSLVVLAALAVGNGGAGAAPPRRGFASYGEPKFEEVFPDTEGMRRWVDTLGTVHHRMDTLRADFARALQRTLGELDRKPAPKGARRCRRLAPPFARAQQLGERYLTEGRGLSRVYELLTKLDDMGESVGLTPDYRAKVKRARSVYRGLLNDYREMKFAFYDQLVPELRHVGCEPEALLRQAPSRAATAPASAPTAPASARAAVPATVRVRPAAARVPAEPPPRPATMVTFYVDNIKCGQSVQVVLDDVPLATIAAGQRRGFRARSGPHRLCLLHDGSARRCGAPGTTRTGYLHEGWTIELRCPR